MIKIRIGHPAYPANSSNALVTVFYYKAAENILKQRGVNISTIRKALILVADGEYVTVTGKQGVVEVQQDFS